MFYFPVILKFNDQWRFLLAIHSKIVGKKNSNTWGKVSVNIGKACVSISQRKQKKRQNLAQVVNPNGE